MRARNTLLTLGLLIGCSSQSPETEAREPEPTAREQEPSPGASGQGEPAPTLDFALAIHGGAGAAPRDLSPEQRLAYATALARGLDLGRRMLDGGESSLDTVERVLRQLEDEPLFNAGRGSVFTAEGTHELDASIMDGRNLACGGVAAVRTVRHPVTLARAVMERTRHVLLAGDGAEQFATEVGVARVENDWFSTPLRRQQWQRVQERERGEADAEPDGKLGTVGAVALDRHGNLAAATSTGGLTGKRWGRIGDSPIIGAGTYADNRTCAVSCTGIGEEFIRRGVARSISARMELLDEGVQAAAESVVGRLGAGMGGVIALSHTGEIALVFNTDRMFRGAVDSAGRFEIAIAEQPEPTPDLPPAGDEQAPAAAETSAGEDRPLP